MNPFLHYTNLVLHTLKDTPRLLQNRGLSYRPLGWSSRRLWMDGLPRQDKTRTKQDLSSISWNSPNNAERRHSLSRSCTITGLMPLVLARGLRLALVLHSTHILTFVGP